MSDVHRGLADRVLAAGFDYVIDQFRFLRFVPSKGE
jgi:hypothetical protein